MEIVELVSVNETTKGVPAKEPEFLTQLAKDIINRQVFTDWHLNDRDDIKNVFIPIALGCFNDEPEEFLADIGMLFARMNEATSRSINGLPSFFSVDLLNKQDAEIVREKCRKIKEFMDTI